MSEKCHNLLTCHANGGKNLLLLFNQPGIPFVHLFSLETLQNKDAWNIVASPGSSLHGSVQNIIDKEYTIYFHNLDKFRPWFLLDLVSEYWISGVTFFVRMCCLLRLNSVEFRVGNTDVSSTGDDDMITYVRILGRRYQLHTVEKCSTI